MWNHGEKEAVQANDLGGKSTLAAALHAACQPPGLSCANYYLVKMLLESCRQIAQSSRPSLDLAAFQYSKWSLDTLAGNLGKQNTLDGVALEESLRELAQVRIEETSILLLRKAALRDFGRMTATPRLQEGSVSSHFRR